MSYKANIFGGVLLLSLTLLVCFILGEFVVRSLISDAQFMDRYVFWSSPHYVLEEDGALHFNSNEVFREFAVYDGELEYQGGWQTNNLGLIDVEDYAHEPGAWTRRIAIVGDSFTAGTGGTTPWVPRLRAALQNENATTYVYNLGVGGAGIDHFQKILVHFRQKLPFNEIVILAISDDFHRPYWKPLLTDDAVRVCPLGESLDVCQKREPRTIVVPFKSSVEYVLGKASELATERRRRLKSSDWNVRDLLGISRVASLAYLAFKGEPLVAAGEKRQSISPILLRFIERGSFGSLQQIRKDFPDINIRLIHIPEKQELARGEYEVDVAEEAKAMGIQYIPALRKCQWSVKGYHLRDPHPNDLGYEHITKCVAAVL